MSDFALKPLLRSKWVYVCAGFVLGLLFALPLRGHSLGGSSGVPMTPFPEPEWRTPDTLDIQTVASTSFARFQIHKVRTENGAPPRSPRRLTPRRADH